MRPRRMESHGATHLCRAVIDVKRGIAWRVRASTPWPFHSTARRCIPIQYLLRHLQSNLGWQAQMASLIQVNYLLNLSEQTDVPFWQSLGFEQAEWARQSEVTTHVNALAWKHACRQGTARLQTPSLAVSGYWCEGADERSQRKTDAFCCLLLANVQDGSFKKAACDSELQHKCKISLSLQSLHVAVAVHNMQPKHFFHTCLMLDEVKIWSLFKLH